MSKPNASEKKSPHKDGTLKGKSSIGDISNVAKKHERQDDMSRQFSELSEMATKVRDHYNELQIADGHKTWNAQDRMAGFVGDVGDLSKLIMVKHNLRRGPKKIDEELAHELSDCLWSVIVIADELGIDLEKSYVGAMQELHARIEAEKADKNRWKRVAA